MARSLLVSSCSMSLRIDFVQFPDFSSSGVNRSWRSPSASFSGIEHLRSTSRSWSWLTFLMITLWSCSFLLGFPNTVPSIYLAIRFTMTFLSSHTLSVFLNSVRVTWVATPGHCRFLWSRSAISAVTKTFFDHCWVPISQGSSLHLPTEAHVWSDQCCHLSQQLGLVAHLFKPDQCPVFVQCPSPLCKLVKHLLAAKRGGFIIAYL